MLNPEIIRQLAGQRIAELRAAAPAPRPELPATGPGFPALRVRAGWTLVAIGLALVTQPGPASSGPVPARPAGS